MPKEYLDLSHLFEDGMPGFKLQNEDGTFTQFTAKIRPFLTREQTSPKYKGLCSFEMTEMTFQTSIGTYLDSPYHRFAEGRDISQIAIDEVVLPGVVVDVRGRAAFEMVSADSIPPRTALRGRAVLFNFGWDRLWGREEYQSYPFISEELVEHLADSGVRLVGVDTVNIDDSRNLRRPAHTRLLGRGILIVENLTGLEKLLMRKFRFFAVPIKGKGAASMPVRAFAELIKRKGTAVI